MIELLVQLIPYSTKWCQQVSLFSSKCEQVRVVKQCKEEYKIVESYLILSPNIKEEKLVLVCRELEVDRRNRLTGRVKIISEKLLN
jgi:hypothetical protein